MKTPPPPVGRLSAPTVDTGRRLSEGWRLDDVARIAKAARAMIDRALDALAGTLPSPGVPPQCDRCDSWHPPDERCGTLRHALDVLDPERVEAPVDERVTCPVCVDRLLRRPDDDICPSCAFAVVSRMLMGDRYVPEVES